MPWDRIGHVFRPPEDHPWMRSHAQVPWPLDGGDHVRVWFGTRDRDGRTCTAWVDLDPHDLTSVVRVGERPAIGPGELGTFDDRGVMPSCVVVDPDDPARLLLFYTGWNTSTTVPYRNSIGLAASSDGGETFQRVHDGPVIDRTVDEPHFCGQPTVDVSASPWRAWFLRCTGWEVVDGKPEPSYDLRVAESDDRGRTWTGERVAVALGPDRARDAALVRPAIVGRGRQRHMWFSARGRQGYRVGGTDSAYRMGYARSGDAGITWARDDAASGLGPPTDGAAWDAGMQAYPAVLDREDGLWMLYNGTGFGATGFGLARWRGELP